MESSYYSLWIRIPAYIVGFIIFCGLVVYGATLIMANERDVENKKSNLKAYLLISFGIVGGLTYFPAWNEKSVIAAFMTNILTYAIVIGSIASGYFSGNKVYLKSSKKWLGWTVGIVIGLLVVITLMVIPGVSRLLENY